MINWPSSVYEGSWFKLVHLRKSVASVNTCIRIYLWLFSTSCLFISAVINCTCYRIHVHRSVIISNQWSGITDKVYKSFKNWFAFTSNLAKSPYKILKDQCHFKRNLWNKPLSSFMHQKARKFAFYIEPCCNSCNNEIICILFKDWNHYFEFLLSDGKH